MLRDELLEDVDDIRGIAGELGLRRYDVYVRRIVWFGSRVGQGSSTTTDTLLLVGGYGPKVKQLRQKDIVGGTDAKDVLYEIGPLTPEFFGGGIAPSVIDPPANGEPAEVYFVIKGPGIADPAGILCQRVDDDDSKAFRYMVRVKRTGRSAA